MKNKWLNLVLLLTNKVYNQKKTIIQQSGIIVIVNIFKLIVGEILLWLISLPLYFSLKPEKVLAYFTEKGVYAKVDFDYKLRRILTITGLSILLFFWILKLVLILAIPQIYGPIKIFNISQLQSSDILNKEIIIEEAKIQVAEEKNNLIKPEIVQIIKDKNGNFIFSGKGMSGLTLVLYVTDKEIVIYREVIDKDGLWTVVHQQSKLKLSEGNHSVSAFVFETKTGNRSSFSDKQFFKVELTFFDQLIKNLDILLNGMILMFVLLGIILTVLTV